VTNKAVGLTAGDTTTGTLCKYFSGGIASLKGSWDICHKRVLLWQEYSRASMSLVMPQHTTRVVVLGMLILKTKVAARNSMHASVDGGEAGEILPTSDL
jgi:hypothetical protein